MTLYQKLYLLALALGGCMLETSPTHPSKGPDTYTPEGIAVTTNGYFVDVEEVDRIAADFEACSGAQLPDWQLEVASNWVISACTGHQVFQCGLAPEACGPPVLNRVACPCRCAGQTIYGQRPTKVLITPNLAALPHELVHVLGHRGHTSPLFQECGQ